MAQRQVARQEITAAPLLYVKQEKIFSWCNIRLIFSKSVVGYSCKKGIVQSSVKVLDVVTLNKES